MRVLNKKYWPYQIEIKNAHRLTPNELETLAIERRRWCRENINGRGWLNVGPVESTFVFKDEDDLLAFKLRWN